MKPPPEVLAAPASARFGNFVRVRCLGSGGFGEVWKAWDSAIGRWVALKFLKGTNDDRAVRFLREARTAATLEHAHIAAIYEVGGDAAQPFIAMQFVDGRTLGAAAKGADPRQVASWIRQAALAVHYAHERGIVHRDLKPDNLMIDGAGHVYVMDFGLAKEMAVESGLTASGMAVGTPAYMSPEQARGETKAADARSDVWSLGATLYELIEGHPPFRGSDVIQILLGVIQDDPVPPQAAEPELAAVVLKCMEKEPRARYPSAQALAEDLERWLDGEAVTAKPASFAKRFERKAARHRILIVAALTALVVAGAGWLALQLSTGRAERAKEELLRQLRETSETCLQTALDQRRTGKLDGLDATAARLEAICDRVVREMPGLAEPHYLLGRARRAQMRDAEALVEQDRALAKDGSFAPARYERVVLLAAKFRERMEVAAEERARREGQRLADLHTYRRATRSELLALDPVVQLLLRALSEDLSRLAGSPALTPAQSACAAGLLDWVEERQDEARARLREAAAKDPDLDEAVLALAQIAYAHDRYAEGETLLTEAIARDRGYVPFLEERGLLRIDRGEHSNRQAAIEALRGAIEDFSSVIGLAPARWSGWRLRGRAHGHLAQALDSSGQDATAECEAAIADFAEAARRAAEEPGPSADEAVVWLSLGAHIESRGADPSTAYETAIERAREALRRRPRTVDALLAEAIARANLGHCASRMGRDPVPSYETAVAKCGEALAVDPGERRAWIQRGLAQVNWALHLTNHGGDGAALVESGVADLKKAVEVAPSDAQARMELASARCNMGEIQFRRGGDPRDLYSLAEKDYNEAIRLAPGWDLAWRGRGLVRTSFGIEQRRRGNSPQRPYEAALADYDKALTINDQRSRTWTDRARLGISWGNWLAVSMLDPVARYEDAIRDAHEAARLNPRSAEAWCLAGESRTNLARWREGVGRGDPMRDYEEAVKDFDESIRVNPGRAQNWGGRATVKCYATSWVLKHGGDPKGWMEGASNDFRKSLQIDAKDVHVWMDYGDFQCLIGKASSDDAGRKRMYREAILSYENALRLVPSFKAQLSSKLAALRKAVEE